MYIGDASLKKILKQLVKDKKLAGELLIDDFIKEINQTKSQVETFEEKALDILGQAKFGPVIEKLCSFQEVSSRQLRAAAFDEDNNLPIASPPAQE